MTTVENIQPIHNHIIIKFVESTASGEFISSNKAGILLASQGDEQGVPRWAQVIKKGPDVDESIQIGTYVLVEPKMWSVGVMFDDDSRYWRTDDSKIMAVADEMIHRY